jgi:hypothetical protein
VMLGGELIDLVQGRILSNNSVAAVDAVAD